MLLLLAPRRVQACLQKPELLELEVPAALDLDEHRLPLLERHGRRTGTDVDLGGARG